MWCCHAVVVGKPSRQCTACVIHADGSVVDFVDDKDLMSGGSGFAKALVRLVGGNSVVSGKISWVGNVGEAWTSYESRRFYICSAITKSVDAPISAETTLHLAAHAKNDAATKILKEIACKDASVVWLTAATQEGRALYGNVVIYDVDCRQIPYEFLSTIETIFARMSVGQERDRIACGIEALSMLKQ